VNDSLSIRSAAHECPNRIALIVDDAEYSYADLASRIEGRSVPASPVHRATATLDTLLTLYAALEARTPLTLLSMGATNSEVEDAQKRIAENLSPSIAIVLFTSGSSGESKGVLLSRDALVASAKAVGACIGWRPNDRWLCCLPLSHVGGLSVVLRCLVARKTVVLTDGFDTKEVGTLLEEKRITHVSLVPTMLWRLLDAGVRSPSDLRTTLLGGASLAPALAAQARDSGFSLRQSYGMTETASMIACDGIMLPGATARLVEGRITLHGPMLMTRYLPPHDVECSLIDGWLTTEDRGTMDTEGRLRILGRLDDTIISGGENINLREIERRLLEYEQIQACMALGLPDAEWGQRLVALVICHGDIESIQFQSLPGHKRPKALIAVEALPLLQNGKPDKQTAIRIAAQKLATRSS